MSPVPSGIDEPGRQDQRSRERPAADRHKSRRSGSASTSINEPDPSASDSEQAKANWGKAESS